ncbi:hypothetical protein Patl1_14702 [Pistacia atlantica]|uniref:Uncharacterized protein n=1 Tax=Pistacia atlantica TaxID=434234 RepID=A0ACC1ATB7_9ROSI|nr:hypothetical protein Patl1_14702 [Pistacia atlantica]
MDAVRLILVMLMAIGLVSNLQNGWPFSLLKSDDLRASDELVRRLRIPEHTKMFNKVQCEEIELGDKGDNSVPTSLSGVIERGFVDRIAYENVAGNLILREIFGIGFNGLFLAAKRAAKEIG